MRYTPLLALLMLLSLFAVGRADPDAERCYDMISQSHPSQCYKHVNATDGAPLCLWCQTLVPGLPSGSCHPFHQRGVLMATGVCNNTFSSNVLQRPRPALTPVLAPALALALDPRVPARARAVGDRSR
jgi:hypothetical protein